MDKVDNSTPKQLGGATGKGFMPGKSGNPAGRPPGSISIMGRIKKMFEEDPEMFEKYVKGLIEDKMMHREIVQQIDGKPVQPIANADGVPFVVKLISYGDNDSVPVPTEDLPA